MGEGYHHTSPSSIRSITLTHLYLPLCNHLYLPRVHTVHVHVASQVCQEVSIDMRKEWGGGAS